MDMLIKEIRIVLIGLVLCASCSDVEKNSTIKISEYHLKSDSYVEANFTNYSKIYTIINDSINLYVDSLLDEFSTEYTTEWQLDSMVAINSANDKLVTTINISVDTCIMDYVSKLYGKKINGKWYFFMGEHLAVPRNYYGKDEKHPLSFHELSQIGRKNFLESALIKNATGAYVINDKWIDVHFYDNSYTVEKWDVVKDKAKYDSAHWNCIMRKWKKKIDTNKYKPFHKKEPPKPGALN